MIGILVMVFVFYLYIGYALVRACYRLPAVSAPAFTYSPHASRWAPVLPLLWPIALARFLYMDWKVWGPAVWRSSYRGLYLGVAWRVLLAGGIIWFVMVFR